jgi:tetratricopeptide (TPR) repeat protein
MKLRLMSLFLALFLLALPAFAIGEITPTPAPNLSEEDYLTQAADELSQGDYGGAVETLSQLLRQFPDNAEGYFLRGTAYTALARNSLALDDYTRAIGLLPWNWDFYVARGDVFVALGEQESALNDFEKAIDLNPRYVVGYYRLSDFARLLNDDEQALIYYTMANAISASEFGDTEQALTDLNDVLERVRDNDKLKAYAFYNRGLIHFNNGDLDSALRDSNSAEEYNPEMHDIFLLRGTVHRLLGDMASAGADQYRRITLLENKQAPRITLENGDSFDMEYGTVATLEMTCAIGDRATVTARDLEGSGVDPLIAILDPTGEPVAGDDDAGEGEFLLDSLVDNLDITQEGAYTIFISHANGGYYGAVTVEYECE